MNKQEVKKMKTNEVLKLIYDNQLIETALNDLPKKELVDFILEALNKGILNDYLRLT